ncbi:MAG: 5'-nucleotidase SurE [Myxococcales bacterium]
MAEPLIFVTNDDGIEAEGLHVLERVAARYGRVMTVAPKNEMSGISHALTLHAPLRVHEHSAGRWSVTGTPADCVYLGINHMATERPALALSGVNHGPNLGYDVIYSGTLAGAREAVIQGVPAIAFSLTGRRPYDFEGAVVALDAVVREALTRGIPEDTLLNVNIPPPQAGHRGFLSTSLGIRHYSGDVERRVDPRGGEYVWIGGKHITYRDIPGSDCNAVRDGWVSVTALQLDTTHWGAKATLDGWGLFTPAHAARPSVGA